MRSTRLRFLIAGLATCALLVIPAVPAQAAVTSEVSFQHLLVRGDAAGNLIAVTCVGGSVKVNGVDPRTGAFACADIEVVTVWAGGGADRVDLGVVDPNAGFSIIGQTEVYGGAGNDMIDGSRASDLLYGNAGYDVMAGGRGRDTFHPGTGGGVVDGGGGVFERVYLHAGGRWFISDNQAHRISGAPVVVSFTAIEEVEIRGGGGADHINARAFDGYTVIYGKKGNDTILAGPFGNWLVGGRGHDTLSGGRGDDELQGRRGHDVLWGRRGSDVIKGGPGVDHCRGGGGPDDIQDCSP